ncbi:exodeoxyribonuclease VII small subunit [Clostridium sp. DL1XJH146]
MKKNRSYEEQFRELKNIIDSFDNEELGLEEIISLYEKGTELTLDLKEKLKSAEGRIKIIQGEVEKNFEKDDEFNAY